MMPKASQFGKVNIKAAVGLLALSVLTAVFYFLGIEWLVVAMSIAAYVAAAIYDPFVCLGVNIVTRLFTSEILDSSIMIILGMIVIVSFVVHNMKNFKRLNQGAVLLISLVLITVSFCFGYDTSLNSAVQMLLCIVRVVLLFNVADYKNLPIVIMAYMVNGVGMIVYFLMCYIFSSNSLLYGRLAFEGSIVTAAVTIAVPFILILSSELEGIRLFENLSLKAAEYIFLAAAIVVMILTVKRVVIIAVIAAVIVQGFITKNRSRYHRFMVPVIIVIVIVVAALIGVNSLRVSRLFSTSEYASGNGRTTLWADHFKWMFENGPLKILFGAGPGDTGRTVSSGNYAHSTYLDFLFSYGIVGFAVMLYFDVKMFIKTVKVRNVVCTTAFITSALIYAGTGMAVNTAMFTLQAVLFLYACADEQKYAELRQLKLKEG